MNEFVRQLHYAHRPTLPVRMLRLLLWLPAQLYGLALVIRRRLYQAGVLPSYPVAVPLIAVGNLTTGGTGKTPVTLMLAEHLRAKGRRVGVLTRGYRSAAEKQGAVITGKNATPFDLSLVGDEASLMAQRLPDCVIGVGADRFARAQTLISDHQVDCLILDDGFQHLRLRRTLNIVVVDAARGFGNGMCLPAGPLRERLATLRAADIVLLTKIEGSSSEHTERLTATIARFVGREAILRLQTQVTAVRDLVTGAPIEIRDRRLWLFSGIGNPEFFAETVSRQGGTPTGQTVFRDHHVFTDQDLTVLRRQRVGGQAELLVTTAKDAARLRAQAWAPGECAVIEIAFDFADRADIFWGIIARCVAA